MTLEADHSRASHTYVLDANGKPKLERNQERWLAWMQANDQPLAETHVAPEVRVSTGFLGMDQRRTKIGAPVLWETMVSAGRITCTKSGTQAAALAGP